MALGIYLDNLSDFEDTGEEVKKTISTPEYSPTFKSNNTFQIWNVMNDVLINRWEGATLVRDTVHEIIINNKSATAVEITFSNNYTLMDSPEISIVLDAGETSAHLYGVGYEIEPGKFTLALRTGSQDNRKV